MPWGVAVDDDGDVYISDWRNDRVQKFTPDGEFIFEFGRTGTGRGEFVRPAGIAVDHDFDIYVCDWGNNRIQLFTPEGRYVQQFTGDATPLRAGDSRHAGRASAPCASARWPISRRRRCSAARAPSASMSNGLMWVPDFESYRLQVYRKEAFHLEPHQLAPPLKAPSLQPN